MKKITLTLFALALVLALGLGSFHLGRGVGIDSMQLTFERASTHLSNLNAIGAYSTHAEISEQISKGRLDHAKCIADVTASVYFKQIRECLNQEACHSLIYEEVKKNAPELLDDNKKKFTFYENQQKCVFASADIKK